MTLLRHFCKAAESLLAPKRCVGLGKNSYNAEYFFVSKIEIPSPPKRPLSAYMIFCKEKRKEILKENPSLSNTEQIKLLAQKWGNLTEDMKKPYELNARQCTQVYSEEHKKFYEGLTEEQRNEIVRLKNKRLESRRILRIKKELRASGIPKHPNSAYILFIQAEAKRKPVVSPPSEFIKKTAEIWKVLPEETKKIYENLSQEEKMTFAKDIKMWRTRMIAEGKEKLVQSYDDLKRRGKLVDTEVSSGKRKVADKPAKEAPVPSTK